LPVDVRRIGVNGDHRHGRRVKAQRGPTVVAAVRLERGEVVAHGAGEGAHGPYRDTVQLLLVRHALPLRSEPGEGSDPDLSEAGVEQARRLPDALARFPITRLLASRSGTLAVAAVNGTEHVWDLLPRNVRW
jgi:hypothetical protein